MSYYNGRQYTFTWESGRRLASVIVDGTELSFTYNDEGIRTSKTVGTVAHVYHLNGAQIVFEESDAAVLVYLYDAEGSPIGMQYRREFDNVGVFEEYWFEKNLQGDIVAVYDGEGTKLISYTYDAWGNFTTTYHNGCTESSAANLNPFRYRGYYYDADTGLYYLQSRYYDPVVGRFLNADIYISTGQGLLGYNMFAYCYNSPVCLADYTGEDAIYVVILSFGKGGLPVVGHAMLYVQDADGNWYATEYTGPLSDPASAKIAIYPRSMEEIKEELSAAKVYYQYIAGDFSASYELALSYEGTNYGGYRVTKNNCLHYVKELLRAGSPKDTWYSSVFNNSMISPVGFYGSLRNFGANIAVASFKSPAIETVSGAGNTHSSVLYQPLYRRENYVY